MQFLQTDHLDSFVLLRADSIHHHGGGGKCGDTAHPVLDGSAPYRFLIETRGPSERRIDEQGERSVPDEIDDMGTAFIHLEYFFNAQAGFAQGGCGPTGRHQLKSQVGEITRYRDDIGFVLVIHRNKYLALARNWLRGG